MPSDLRKYLEYTAHIKVQYGSVMRFVVKERLEWGDGDTEDMKPKGGLFEFNGKVFCCVFSSHKYGLADMQILVFIQRTFESYLTTGLMALTLT